MVTVLNLLVDYETKIGKLRYFHVAFARLMELTNKIATSVANKTDVRQERLAFGFLLLGLFPYAPHMTSELWAELALCKVGDI